MRNTQQNIIEKDYISLKQNTFKNKKEQEKNTKNYTHQRRKNNQKKTKKKRL